METLFGNFTLDDIYNAISFAETGSFNNPWIRTVASGTPGGSTAYGPVQITGGLLTNYADNEPGVYNNNKGIADLLREQASLFSFHGNEPEKQRGYSPIWDYGGTGFNLTDIQKGQYKTLAQDMMLDMWDKNKNKDDSINSFIEAWRGKTIDEDPEYYKRFNTHLGR